MNQERLYQVVVAPHISEKATIVAEANNTYVFKVAKDATKAEIKEAIETIFEVTVTGVNTVNIKGKTKRTARGFGKRNDTRKAYVTLAQGQEIELGGE